MFNKKRNYLEFFLAAAFFSPEIVSVGGVFLRWDYLYLGLIYFYFLPDLSKKGIGSGERNTALRLWIIWGVLLFSFVQVLYIKSSTDFFPAFKYAVLPIKILVWAIAVRWFYIRFKFSIDSLYRFFYSSVCIVLSMQMLELYSEGFRTFLFAYYPVAAEDRLLELTFRARGPFGGYDAASLFYCVSGIVLNESCRLRNSSIFSRLSSIAICLVGAFIAARTGFFLFLGYLLVRGILDSSLGTKIIFIGASFFIFSLLGLVVDPAAEDADLAGRYLEVVGALMSGDLTGVQSVYGTFDMNSILNQGEWDFIFGAGLTVETTADQLYAKYFYMFGVVGTVLWIILQFIFFLSAFESSGPRGITKRVACASSLFISVVFIFAHIKGGNYYFAQRLGEFAMLIALLATSRLSGEKLQSKGK